MPALQNDEFEALMNVLKKNYKAILALNGAYRADVGFKYVDNQRTDQLAIRAHVHQKHTKKLLRADAMPKKLDGITTDVIVNTPKNNGRSGEMFPVLGGGMEITNISIYGNGTLGGIFKDVNSNIVGLSNHHVLVGHDGRKGHRVAQPYHHTFEERDIVGSVLDFSEEYDCAIFQLNNKRHYDTSIIDLSNGLLSVATGLRPGLPVAKSGITTEITYGEIDGIDPNHEIFIRPNPNKPNKDNVLSDDGDSGSIWIVDDHQKDKAVCLHTQGSVSNDGANGFSMAVVMHQMKISFL